MLKNAPQKRLWVGAPVDAGSQLPVEPGEFRLSVEIKDLRSVKCVALITDQGRLAEPPMTAISETLSSTFIALITALSVLIMFEALSFPGLMKQEKNVIFHASPSRFLTCSRY